MSLPQHPNALTFTATLADGASLSETYYSVGGGFILQEGESEQDHPSVSLPFPIESAEDLLDHCSAHALGVPEVVWRNELAWRTREAIQPELGAIWRTMKDSVFRGCHTRGVLPGGLGVVRRAAGLAEGMLGPAAGLDVDSWLENGAAGVVPAVLLYHLCFCGGDERDVRPFLLTAAEIGSIIQKKATISAAMGGCQAEIGVSSAMAAAGLTSPASRPRPRFPWTPSSARCGRRRRT